MDTHEEVFMSEVNRLRVVVAGLIIENLAPRRKICLRPHERYSGERNVLVDMVRGDRRIPFKSVTVLLRERARTLMYDWGLTNPGNGLLSTLTTGFPV
jgi:hypothetical protein